MPTTLTRVILGFLLVMSWALSVAGEPVRVGILAPGFGNPIICQLEAPEGAPRHNMLGMYTTFRVE